MANRPIFTISSSTPYYSEKNTEFIYYSGFAEVQKHKCIQSLHDAFKVAHPSSRVLEVSTKSEDPTGVALSAFNLRLTLKNGAVCTLESAFQASKVFEQGGPYLEILSLTPWESKKYPRLKDSGKIIDFNFEGKSFSKEPATFFYDWLYINVVSHNEVLRSKIIKYDAFTDIEFNPKKSINCQAKSAAIYVSLNKKGLLDDALKCPECFRKIIYGQIADNYKLDSGEQMELF